MNVTVVGSGYVGLVTGTCFSEMGNRVICVDKDKGKIEKLNQGIIPIYEPGLEEMLLRNKREERISFTTDLRKAVEQSQLCFIAVNTPPGEDGSADLTHVLNVARDIARFMNEYKIIVNKSTVPVGTADLVKQEVTKILQEREENHDFAVVSNPEFLKEGNALEDFMKPDRVVIGTDKKEVGETMTALYSPFNRVNERIMVMSVRSAEMTKYAANAMLATKISFINEIARLCELTGADVAEVRKGIGSDSRIGYKFIYPGVGYGGSCFPKDIAALVKMGEQNKLDLQILRAVETVNEQQKMILVEKVKRHFGNDLSGKRFAVWGLAFKPQTDDMRKAPSLTIIDALLKAGAAVRACDPIALTEAKKAFGKREGLSFFEDNYEVLEGADALLLITEWHQFRYPDFSKMKQLMKDPVVFDGRNQYNPQKMKETGFIHYSIGRP
jgi:UDPglucose 6-dehydrogenase